jgi:hypothetical protein
MSYIVHHQISTSLRHLFQKPQQASLKFAIEIKKLKIKIKTRAKRGGKWKSLEVMIMGVRSNTIKLIKQRTNGVSSQAIVVILGCHMYMMKDRSSNQVGEQRCSLGRKEGGCSK